MEELQLEDLLAFYPDIEDENFQALLSSKREFLDLASFPEEELSDVRGSLFNHQKLFGRLVRFYDKFIMMLKPGTGKTCAAISSMEHFIDENVRNEGPITNFFAIVPNKHIMKDLKLQIVCSCTNGKYETEKLKNASTRISRENQLSRILKQNYKIYTRKMFIREVTKLYPDKEYLMEVRAKELKAEGKEVKFSKKEMRKFQEEEEINNKLIREHYSGSFFYIDEVHLLTTQETIEENIEDETEEKKKKEKETKKKGREKEEDYRRYHRVLHLVERSKIVLATATPMINSTRDIERLINLIRPLDDQLPSDFDYNGSTIEEVNRYFGGYITYIRPVDNKVDVIREGEPVKLTGKVEGQEYKEKLRLELSILKGTQLEGYKEARRIDHGNFWMSHSLMSSVFVFPDGTWGKDGFDKYTRPYKIRLGDTGIYGLLDDDEEEEGKKKRISSFNWYKPTSEFSDKINSIEKIRKLSAIFARIAELAENSPGVIHVIMPYIKGGAIPLALCLEQLGYSTFLETSTVFEVEESEDGEKSFCAKYRKNIVIKDSFIKKMKKRKYVALLSNIFPDSINANALELTSSKENYNGDFIKIIITTPYSKVGININNVSQIHDVRSEWNEGNNLQKESRGIRATSHVVQLREAREKAFQEGTDEEDVRIEVKLYRHVVMTKDGNSATGQLWLRSYVKEFPIQSFFRKLMRVAIDCNFNKARNQLPPLYDNTIECNYTTCEYQCYQEADSVGFADPLVKAIDYSTYDVYYLDEYLVNIIKDIIPVLREKSDTTYDDIMEKVKLPRRHIIAGISEMINGKMMIKDRFGFPVYVQEDNGRIFFVRNYPLTEMTYDSSYYGENLILADIKEFEEIKKSFDVFDISSIENELRDLYGTMSDEKLKEKIEEQQVNVKSSLLESSISRTYYRENDEFDDFITDMFSNSWRKIKEPVSMIKIEETLSKKSKRGRKPKEGKKKITQRIAENIEIIEDKNTEEVFYHVLNTPEFVSQHAETANIMKAAGIYRFFKPSENRTNDSTCSPNCKGGRVWRDLSDDVSVLEYRAYNKIEQKRVRDLFNSFTARFEIYGLFIRSSGNFKIIDKTQQSKESTKGSMEYTGRKCDTWTPASTLIPIMWSVRESGLLEPEDVLQDDKIYFENNPNKQRHELKEKGVDVKRWSDEKVDFFYKWGMILSDKKKYPKRIICEQIKTAMEREGKLLVI